VAVLDKVMATVPAADKKDYGAIEKATRAFCKKALEKENRLVRMPPFQIGGA